MNHELIVILYLLQVSKFDTRKDICHKIVMKAKCTLSKCSNCPLELGCRDFKEKYTQLIVKTSQTMCK